MTRTDLEQLAMHAELDDATARLKQWIEAPSAWSPMRQCQTLIRRVLVRVEVLNSRLDTPLVVATFGGSGTGKSSLVNALVGEECSPTGRERPTTHRPLLIAHPDTDLASLGLPTNDVDCKVCGNPILHDVVILDCPDPDTRAASSTGSNRDQLRRLLPYCDVLIYTSTQQKYRSARVAEELGQAAIGCQLVFVQTHADLEDDIRQDWQRQLEPSYAVPEIFLIDSVRAMTEQAQGQTPDGDFGRLQQLVMRRLGAAHRPDIRCVNILDLLLSAVHRCQEQLHKAWSSVGDLEAALAQQQEKLVATMCDRLRDELLQSRHLWERRLLASVTDAWGFSPFSVILRTFNGLGNWLMSLTLFRARTSAQVALIGAFQGIRWLGARRKRKEAESHLERVSTLGLDDAVLHESQLIVSGYVRDARIERPLSESVMADTLRDQAARVEADFLGDASSRIDRLIDELATQSSGKLTRFVYESLFLAYVAFVLLRIGENFFYGSFVKSLLGHSPDPLLSVDFYIPALLFFVLWSALLTMLFTRRLRRGLETQIQKLASDLARNKLAQGLFPDLEEVCRQTKTQKASLDRLLAHLTQLRNRLPALSGLGASLRSPPEQTTP